MTIITYFCQLRLLKIPKFAKDAVRGIEVHFVGTAKIGIKFVFKALSNRGESLTIINEESMYHPRATVIRGLTVN